MNGNQISAGVAGPKSHLIQADDAGTIPRHPTAEKAQPESEGEAQKEGRRADGSSLTCGAAGLQSGTRSAGGDQPGTDKGAQPPRAHRARPGPAAPTAPAPAHRAGPAAPPRTCGSAPARPRLSRARGARPAPCTCPPRPGLGPRSGEPREGGRGVEAEPRPAARTCWAGPAAGEPSPGTALRGEGGGGCGPFKCVR